jgi:hypothetical protein
MKSVRPKNLLEVSTVEVYKYMYDTRTSTPVYSWACVSSLHGTSTSTVYSYDMFSRGSAGFRSVLYFKREVSESSPN